MKSSVEQMKECKEFARINLGVAARELIEWHKTGFLRDGKMRELANMCLPVVGGVLALQIAEDLVKSEALKVSAVASIEVVK